MKNFFEEYGIEPKMIDYGDDTINVKFRSIDKGTNLFSNAANRDKKKKSEE